MIPLLADVRTTVALLLAFGFAVCDLWVFRRLDSQVDLTILLGALAGAGVSAAHTAGVNAATTTPQPPPRP